MKLATLALALWFMGAQVTYWVDCCCGSFCLRKDACTGCQDISMGEGNPKAGHGCLNQALGMDPSKGCKQDACSHLEPQGDVKSIKADHDFIPAPVFLGLLPTVLNDPGAAWVPHRRESRSPPHAEDPPLYLRFQVLLI